MYSRWKHWVLALLKVPAQPHPPAGDPKSLRIFHAGKNYLWMRLAAWTLAQLLALAGILFWTAMLIDVEIAARQELAAKAVKESEASAVASEGAVAQEARKSGIGGYTEKFVETFNANRTKHHSWQAFRQSLIDIGRGLPPWAFVLIWIVKILGIVVYLAQIPLTFAIRRLDYEMRWYMVTDRSLRLRHGVVNLSESTMSFANIQQVTVAQNPLQRLLGLADVQVRSAGGGSSRNEMEKADDDMHVGQFHSVTNAAEIRDLILDRLRHFRQAGLGDPDDHRDIPSGSSANAAVKLGETTLAGPVTSAQLAAAREVLEEAQRLRRSLSSSAA